MRNADKPITPVALGVQNSDAQALENGDLIGLTKREYFAAMALQGIMGNSQILPNKSGYEYCAKIAVTSADALLAELDKPTL